MPYTIEAIDSDKDTHFTGALAQNAIENENISFPTDFSLPQINKIAIHQISIQSDQALNWDLILWSGDGFANTTDIDSDAHIVNNSFLASEATQIAGSNQSYYNYNPVTPILYIDKDNSGELHVGLINRSITAKIAGATGEIKVRFMVEPIL